MDELPEDPHNLRSTSLSILIILITVATAFGLVLAGVAILT